MRTTGSTNFIEIGDNTNYATSIHTEFIVFECITCDINETRNISLVSGRSPFLTASVCSDSYACMEIMRSSCILHYLQFSQLQVHSVDIESKLRRRRIWSVANTGPNWPVTRSSRKLTLKAMSGADVAGCLKVLWDTRCKGRRQVVGTQNTSTTVPPTTPSGRNGAGTEDGMLTVSCKAYQKEHSRWPMVIVSSPTVPLARWTLWSHTGWRSG